LLAILVLLATGQVGFHIESGAQRVSASVLQDAPTPKIINARLNGKKLIIAGENFSAGDVIVVNGKAQKTKNDSENPTTMLIAKKAGKKMEKGEISSITVQRSDGTGSDEFNFFKGLTVTLDDVGKTISLNAGDKFLLILNRSPYKWEASVQDSAVVEIVEDTLPVLGAIAIYKASKKGQTNLSATGSLACHNSNPPCSAPSLQFQVNVVVK
jgi:predicted secreted protein